MLTTITRCFGWLVVAMALGACGFKLAGSDVLPQALNSIYLVTSNFSERQEQALRDRLVRAGAELRPQPGDGTIQLTLNWQVLPDRRLVSSARTGKTVERLARGLEFSLENADGSLLAPSKRLYQQNDIQLDDDNLLSSEQERLNLIEDLEQVLFNRLILQLKRI